jgi:Flp pilus assembly protein TadG
MAERSVISLRALLRDRGGVAAVEFAIAAAMVIVGVFNAIDVGVYSYRRMEVENAAQAGARAAWKTCYDQSYMLPASINCPGLNAAITTAVHNTSLGTAITLSPGYPTEGYYCTTSTNTLMAVGSLSSKPASCSAAGNAGVSPGDYIQVGVTYSYTSLVPGLSVISASGISSITTVSWMRLG